MADAWPHQQLHVWPSRDAAAFSRAPTHKLIRAPAVYHATYDTLPPPAQVIKMEPTANVLRSVYQQADRKMAGKRDGADGSPRPQKTQRCL